MEKQKRTYANAGQQNSQGWSEMHRYGEFGPDHLVTVKCVSLVLGIRLQMVKQIPVTRRMINKCGYYRKGDIEAWIAEDLAKPDSLLRALREQHAKSLKRIADDPSRRYVSGQLKGQELREVIAKRAGGVPPVSKDELTGAWQKRDAKSNRPVLGPPKLTEKDAEACSAMSAWVRDELKRGQ